MTGNQWTPLNHLTDDEIIRRHYSSLDPLTTSDIEIELAQRLEKASGEASLCDALVEKLHGLDETHVDDICEAISGCEIEASEIAGCVEALADAGIKTVDDLKKLLEAAANIAKLELSFAA